MDINKIICETINTPVILFFIILSPLVKIIMPRLYIWADNTLYKVLNYLAAPNIIILKAGSYRINYLRHFSQAFHHLWCIIARR